MNGKGKVVAKFSDKRWLWDFTLLCSTSHYINDLNTKLQGQQKLISDMFRAITAFKMKLIQYVRSVLKSVMQASNVVGEDTTTWTEV
jgi:hypothetical protein